MKQQIINIYRLNQLIIDPILDEYGFPKNLNGLIEASKDDEILFEIYSAINNNWRNADGSGWQKFKDIFSKTTDVVGKINTGTTIANSFFNQSSQSNKETQPEPEKKKWSPNILVWGGIGVALIIILLLIYLFRS